MVEGGVEDGLKTNKQKNKPLTFTEYLLPAGEVLF